MYTQEIACPNCGRLTAVNFLDKQGSTTTPCVHCATRITVRTNSDGEVVAIEHAQGGCYVVTACLANRGPLEQDGDLTVIKHFRDTYVAKLESGAVLLNSYYERAPALVAAINTHPQAGAIYEQIHTDFIAPALELIRRAEPDRALALYAELDRWLSDLLNPDREPNGSLPTP